MMECKDMLQEILFRLPLLDLNSFKCVNKQSNALICSPEFERDRHRVMGDSAIFSSYNREEQVFDVFQMQSRFDRSAFIKYLELPEFEFDVNATPVIIGSFNGLVCVKYDYVDYMLWNPETGECEGYSGGGVLVTDYAAVGFCYNAVSDEYMAVVVGYVRFNWKGVSSIEIINFSASTCNFFYSLSYDLAIGLEGVGTVVGGVSHWIKERDDMGRLCSKKWFILFDPTTEMFDEIEMPKGAAHQVTDG